VGTTVYSGTNTYSYDKTNQVLSTGSETFNYDANGNRTMAGYQTGANNRLSNDGTYTYTYDPAGNLIEKSKGSGLETWYYTYDNKNELLSVRDTSDGSTNLLTLTYTYDALGNQVSQTEWKSSGGGAVVTEHAYDDHGNVWADLTSANTIEMRYIRAASTNQLLAQVDGGGNLFWYLTDKLGSVRDVVSAAGTTITDHIDYGAFGKIVLETNSIVAGRAYLYTGLAEDRDTGIVQARHRTLLVTTGQWMQEDPLGFGAGDTNLRRYVGNSPIQFTDPSGEFGFIVIAAIAIGVICFMPTNAQAPGLDGPSGGAQVWDWTPAIVYGGMTYFILANLTVMASCFPAGTLVDTTAGLRAIETIETGSEVWAYDLVSSTWRSCRVLKTFATHYEGLMSLISVSDETIEATFLHPFWVMRGEALEARPRREHLVAVPEKATTPGRWVDAGDLREGDEVLLRDGRVRKVCEVKHRSFKGPVYNILVDDLHNYAVGKNGVLAHNMNGMVGNWLARYFSTSDELAVLGEQLLGVEGEIAAAEAAGNAAQVRVLRMVQGELIEILKDMTDGLFWLN
jgi:RHS repeat-associated protein